MLRAARVAPPQEAIGRVAPGLGWFGLGALLPNAAIALQRPREPDGGQEPDVGLDVPELEVDRITLEVRTSGPTSPSWQNWPTS